MGSCVGKSNKQPSNMGQQLDKIQEQLKKQYDNSHINTPIGYDPPLDRQVFVRDMKDRNHLRKQSHHNSFVKHNY